MTVFRLCIFIGWIKFKVLQIYVACDIFELSLNIHLMLLLRISNNLANNKSSNFETYRYLSSFEELKLQYIVIYII